MSPLKPNDLDLAAIHPSLGAKYSPNLFAYLSKSVIRVRFARVYRDVAGVHWIGFPDEEFFVGARLMSVLCNGIKTQTFAHVRLLDSLTEVENFWREYMRDGRCAIDAEHKEHFVGDDNRWTVHGDSRSCTWCGKAVQHMRRWTETVEKAAWTAASDQLAA